jgi:phage-related protein
LDTVGTSAELRLLGNSADKTGDEISEAGMKAGITSGTFSTLSLSSSGLAASLGMTGSSALGLSVALGVLSTALLPLVATVGAVAAGAVALGGAFGAIIGSAAIAAQQSGWLGDELQEMKQEVASLVAAFGQQFTPLLRDAINAIPRLVQKMISAVGGTEQFRNELRRLGGIAMEVIPQLTAFMFDLARTALPIFRNFVNFLMGSAGPAFRSLEQSVKSVWPEVMNLLDALVRLSGPLLRFGTQVANVVLPALTGLINGLRTLLTWISQAGSAVAPFANQVMNLGIQFGLVEKDIKGAGLALAALAPILLGLGGPITAAIGLITAFGIAWSRNILGIRTKTKKVMAQVGTAIKTATRKARQFLQQAVQRMKQIWKQNLQPIFQTTKQKFQKIKNTITRILKSIWSNVVRPILSRMKKF